MIKPLSKYICLLVLICMPVFLVAQIDTVLVETYYVSGPNDTTDVLNVQLPAGAKTYRVYVQVEDGYTLKSFYADKEHPITISSDQNFFNHMLSVRSYGYLVNSLYLSSAATFLPLDSWITIGFASGAHIGVKKDEDKDTSIFVQGLLENNAPHAGMPLHQKDGLIKGDSSYLAYRLTDFEMEDSTFRNKTTRKEFVAYEPVIRSLKGYPVNASNRNVLVGQFTTSGKLEFEINLELEKEADGFLRKFFVVARDTNIGYTNTRKDSLFVFSNQLKFPPQCGCMDPYFAQFDPSAVCTEVGACKDSIVMGCTDPLACNYNPGANLNVKEICCYGPDNCDNRDIAVVCPNYRSEMKMGIYPNPAAKELTLEFLSVPAQVGSLQVSIINAYGEVTSVKILDGVYEGFSDRIDLTAFGKGLYIVRVGSDKGESLYSTFIKN